MRVPGVAVLDFTVTPDASGGGTQLTQTAKFRPRGLPGLQPPMTAFTSASARTSSTAMTPFRSQSASGNGASAGPEITSPVGLKRDP